APGLCRPATRSSCRVARAQVNLLGPCDRSFQTTPLTMSSAARPISRETPSPGAARHIGMAACNRRRVLQIRRQEFPTFLGSGRGQWSTLDP
ncbi:MAG: hypothetical protein ACK56F_02275, partial [bacterium]